MFRIFPKYSQFLVYGLYLDNKLFYIGASTCGLTRPRTHIKENYSKDFFVHVIEECVDKKSLYEREAFWIKHFKDTGVKLLNVSMGVGKNIQKKSLKE